MAKATDKQKPPAATPNPATHPEDIVHASIGTKAVPVEPVADVVAIPEPNQPAAPEPTGEPLYIVKIEFRDFKEGQKVTLRQVYAANCDPDFLLSNGALCPLNAGGVHMMGVLKDNGSPNISLESHENTIAGLRAQLEDEHRQRTLGLQQALDIASAKEKTFDAILTKVKTEAKAAVDAAERGAKQEGARSATLEIENQNLKEECEKCKQHVAQLEGMVAERDQQNGDLKTKIAELEAATRAAAEPPKKPTVE